MCTRRKIRFFLLAGLLSITPATTVFSQEIVPVQVRAGDHEGFSRVVFDFLRAPDYEASVVDDVAEIRIAGQIDPNFGRLTSQALIYASAPTVSIDGTDTVITLRVPPGAGIRDFLSGPKLIVDFTAPAPGAVAEIEPDEFEAQIENVVSAPGAIVAPSGYGDSLPVRTSGSLTEFTLTYDWDEPVAAAVFQRAGHLWVIFESSRRADHTAVLAALNDRLRGAEQLPHRDATILRYRILSGQNIQVQRNENSWQVILKDRFTNPRLPIQMVRQPASSETPGLFFDLREAGGRFIVGDPSVGDDLLVATAAPGGNGIADASRFAEFRVLETAQGIAIERFRRDIVLERFLEGVAVTSPRLLALSETDPGDAQQARVDEPKRLVDFPAWRREELGGYIEGRGKLQYDLALADANRRNGARWALARYHLAHGMSAASIGLLELMVEEDEALNGSPEFRIVRGVSNAQMGRNEEALNDLNMRELQAEPDANLWRMLVSERLGQNKEALDQYRLGEEAVSNYGSDIQLAVHLAATRASIANDDLIEAADELARATSFAGSNHQEMEKLYLRAQINELQGDRETALALYQDVESGTDRELYARASFARLAMMGEAGDISDSELLDELDGLRYAWRGDSFEFNILRDIGKLYVKAGDYRAGLDTLKQAIEVFPDEVQTRDVSSYMEQAFHFLFLEGGADPMQPVAALALYFDFRELTPLGTEGDQMIRRLTDRLVSVDLLDRAAELLEYQVRFRLEGASQAQIAARLGKIYLLNKKPEQALEILRATRQERLLQEIQRERRLVEGRALVELARYEEAEVLLEGDSGPEIDLIRDDIYWGSRDWDKVIAHSADLLDGREVNSDPLDDLERQRVMRQAIARAMQDDWAGLRRLNVQFGEHMSYGVYAQAFDLFTNDEDRSGRELATITRNIAAVDQLQSFMTDYKAEFATN